jgi:hypothetical protein
MERVALRCHYEDVPLRETRRVAPPPQRAVAHGHVESHSNVVRPWSVIPGIIEWCPTVVHVSMNGLNAERRGFGISASLASCLVIVIASCEPDSATFVRWCGWNLSTKCGFDVWSRNKMKVPNALPAPITPFANSRESFIAQVVG